MHFNMNRSKPAVSPPHAAGAGSVNNFPAASHVTILKVPGSAPDADHIYRGSYFMLSVMQAATYLRSEANPAGSMSGITIGSVLSDIDP